VQVAIRTFLLEGILLLRLYRICPVSQAHSPFEPLPCISALSSVPPVNGSVVFIQLVVVFAEAAPDSRMDVFISWTTLKGWEHSSLPHQILFSEYLHLFGEFGRCQRKWFDRTCIGNEDEMVIVILSEKLNILFWQIYLWKMWCTLKKITFFLIGLSWLNWSCADSL